MSRKIQLLIFFVLLIVMPIPLSYQAGEDAGGGGEVHLDYEDHDPYSEDHDAESQHEQEKNLKKIDFESRDNPIQYEVALWLNNVGKIDKEAGVYELDFWFVIESDEINFLEVETPPMGFINSKTVKLDSEYVEEHYYEVRVRGIFFNILDFHEYPFEKLELIVEAEPDMPYHIENAVFSIDEELVGIDEKVNVVGWELAEPTFEVVTHDYENWHSFSRFIATIPIERSVTGALMKTFLPVTVIAGISLLIFFIPENFTPRIYLTAPLLLALVFLHRGALGELPTLSHMTIFDKVMVIYYAIMANSIISLAIQMKIHVQEHDIEKIKKVNRMMLYFVPVIVVVLGSLLFLT